MKKLTVFILAVLIVSFTQAQHVFNKGSIMFNAGIGVPASKGFIPTINFSGEIGVIPTGDIGLVSFGGLTEVQFAHHNWFGDKEPFVRFFVGARAAWHVHAFTSDVFDAYAGAGFGVRVSGSTDHYNSNTSFEPDIFVGGRWMFMPGLGLFAEVGYSGLSPVKAGITFGL